MKYCVIILDGAAGWPLPELGGRTTLQAAATPNLDMMARSGSVGLAQTVYLVGFSYAFFWQGMTGLTVTVGAIVTLFILMQATGRVDWFDVFARRNVPPPIPPQRINLNS